MKCLKIREEFYLTHENGQNIVESSLDNFNNSIILGNTAAMLFEYAKTKDLSRNDMLTFLLENTDISTVLALNDLNIFIKLMKENDIFE